MRTSTEISAMSARSPSALKRLDWFMSDSNKDLKTKWAATEFVLKRIFPEKTILGGLGENGEFEIKVEILNENNFTPEARNRIQQYVAI